MNRSETKKNVSCNNMHRYKILSSLKKRNPLVLFVFLNIIIFLISLSMFLKNFVELNKAEQSFEELSSIVEKKFHETQNFAIINTNEDELILSIYGELSKINDDMFGWIKIEGTKIDYPVMYTPNDSEYYLRRDFYKKKSISGVPFLDGTYSPHGGNYIVYGHNMNNGTIFNTLLSYEKKSFWKEHPEIVFDTLNERGKYEVIGAFYSRVYYQDERNVFRFYSYQDVTNPSIFQEYVSNVKEVSLYDTTIVPEYGDQLLTLITCAYNEKNGRFVVVARKISP